MRVCLVRWILPLAFVALLTPALHATASTLTSIDGQKTLTISDDSQSATYLSNNGVATFTVNDDGSVQVGSSSILITQRADILNAFDVEITTAGQQVLGSAVVDSQGNLTATTNWDAVTQALQTIAATPEGQLLLESHTVFSVSPGNYGGYGDQLDGLLTCIGAVFNQVAAGAAAIGGCGTPSCGPAFKWCCGAGVAWYAAAFIGTWESCRISGW